MIKVGHLKNHSSQIHKKITEARTKRAEDLIKAFGILTWAVVGRRVISESIVWDEWMSEIERSINPNQVKHKSALKWFRARFHQIFQEEWIIFPPKMWRKTMYQVLSWSTWNDKLKWYSQKTEDFENFWNDYGWKRIFQKKMKEPSMRQRVAMEYAIWIFNTKYSQKAGFRLLGKNWKDILAHVLPWFWEKKTFWKEVIINHSSYHILYGTLPEIREFIQANIVEFNEYLDANWWQKWWTEFAKKHNNPELAIKRWFLIPTDVRLLRDALRIKTIKKDVILQHLRIPIAM